jgi:3D (Asp-Asp-Asp) domain-containing protein
LDGRYVTYYYGVLDQLTTASGAYPTAGRTIAVDPQYIPRFGSTKGHVYITGIGNRLAEDVGGSINGYHIDVFTGFGVSSMAGMSNGLHTVQYRGNNNWTASSGSAMSSSALSSINDLYMSDSILSDNDDGLLLSRVLEGDLLAPENDRVAIEKGNYSAYVSKIDYTVLGGFEVTITNKEGTPIKVHLNLQVKSVKRMKFLPDNRLEVISKINPTWESCEIFDIDTGDLVEIYYGCGFTRFEDGRMIYVVPKPHFGPGDRGNNKIVDQDGNILYESEAGVMIRGKLSLVDDCLNFEEIDVNSLNSTADEPIFERVVNIAID